MGVATSREVTLPADASTRREAAALDAADEEQQRVAAEAFRKAEEALFREGYDRGSAEAVGKLDVDLAARAALAVSLLSEESAQAKLVTDAAAQLRRSQYRAPLHAPACVEEEAAVLACDFSAPAPPGSVRGPCANVADAYVRCSERVVLGLMKNPLHAEPAPMR